MEIDDRILKDVIDRLNITKEQARTALQELIDDGFLQENNDPSVPMEFKLTNSGSKFAENVIKKDYGEFKKVTDHNGVSYRVPTVVIMREGIKEEELNQFPLWSNE